MWRVSVAERTNIPMTRSILYEWEHVLTYKKKQEKGKRRAFTEISRRNHSPSFPMMGMRIHMGMKTGMAMAMAMAQ
jgi:hypothetical protein